MAKKKQDMIAEINTEPIYKTVQEAIADAQEPQETGKTRKERKTYTADEEQEYMQGRRTSGRKGVKLPRINMAFSPELYDYIRTVSMARGQTMTDFLNHIVEKSMEENREVYEKALEFRNSF